MMTISLSIIRILTATSVAILAMPNFGICQSLGHHSLRPRTIITTNEFKKDALREALKTDFESTRPNSSYRLKILRQVEEESESSRKSLEDLSKENLLKSGGWTGGGGTGIVCFKKGPFVFAKFPSLADEQGRIRPEAYKDIQVAQMLDFKEIGEGLYIPVIPGETSLTYLRRILEENYAPRLPIFSSQLQELIQVISQQMQTQLQAYETSLKPEIRPQLTIEDYGIPTAIQLNTYPTNCRPAQVATRFAKIGLNSIIEFFIDFDEALVLKMRQLAKTPEEAIVNEASLILHEATYLIGSSIEQMNSSVMTFGFVPYFLSQKSLDEMTALSRGEAARLIRGKLKGFGLHQYHRLFGIHDANSYSGLLPVSTLVHLNRAFFQADMKYIESAAQELSPRDQFKSLLEERLADYRNRPESRYIMRTSNVWQVLLIDIVADSGSNEFAFAFVSSVIEPKGDGVIDDLFLKTSYSDLAKISFCEEIRQQKESYRNSFAKTYKKMDLIFDRAINFCR